VHLLSIIGEIVGTPELHRSDDDLTRLTLIVLAEPEQPSVLWPIPPQSVLVVAAGPGVERVARELRAGNRIRIEGWTETGVVLNATAIRPLDPLPDTPAIPSNHSVLLRVTRPGAPTLN
jgi:hypothetical protein